MNDSRKCLMICEDCEVEGSAHYCAVLHCCAVVLSWANSCNECIEQAVLYNAAVPCYERIFTKRWSFI